MNTVKIVPEAPICDDAFVGEQEAEPILLKATIIG